ncbi:MAG: putative metal-binding motif-containing protein [Myxococcota bacterium]|nr:putative metal-binding motif-containing protein [Myxococcota bacterium]
MYLSLTLVGCGFGLQPLNPLNLEGERSVNGDEYEADVTALESGTLTETNPKEREDDALVVITDIGLNHALDVYEGENSINETEKYDADGDGFSVSDGDCDDTDSTIFPTNPDLAGDGIDQDCDGFDSDEDLLSCVYTVRMLCGYDGWEGLWLQAKANGAVQQRQPLDCYMDAQFWQAETSENFSVTANPGETLALHLCQNSDCSSLPSETYDIGVVVFANDTLIEQSYSPSPLWNLEHTCPK